MDAGTDIRDRPRAGGWVPDRLPHRYPAQEDDVGRGRVDRDVQVVESLPRDVPSRQRDRRPGGARVGRAKECVHQVGERRVRVGRARQERVDRLRRRGRDPQGDPREAARRKAAGELRPARLACYGRIRRLEDPFAPDRGIHGCRRHRIDADVGRVETGQRRSRHLRPVRPGIDAPVDAIACRRKQSRWGTGRDRETTEPCSRECRQPEVRPGIPSVRGLQHSIAVVAVTREVALAGAGVESQGIAGIHRQGADRERDLVVGPREPVEAAVRRLPDAALRRAEIHRVRVRGIDHDSRDAAGDEHARRGICLALRDHCGTELHPVARPRNGGDRHDLGWARARKRSGGATVRLRRFLPSHCPRVRESG